MTLEVYISEGKRLEEHQEDTRAIIELILETLSELAMKEKKWARDDLILKIYRNIRKKGYTTSLESIARYLRKLRAKKIITSTPAYYYIITYNVRTELARRRKNGKLFNNS